MSLVLSVVSLIHILYDGTSWPEQLQVQLCPNSQPFLSGHPQKWADPTDEKKASHCKSHVIKFVRVPCLLLAVAKSATKAAGLLRGVLTFALETGEAVNIRRLIAARFSQLRRQCCVFSKQNEAGNKWDVARKIIWKSIASLPCGRSRRTCGLQFLRYSKTICKIAPPT